jgi:hypothetical protein
LVFAAAMLAGVAPVGAASWDAYADFSLAGNPNGPWQYGFGIPGGSFTALADATTSLGGIAGFEGWHSAGAPFGVPAVYANNTGGPVTIGAFVAPAASLIYHPGDSDDSAAMIRFVVPATGTYRVEVRSSVVDGNSGGVITHGHLNGSALFAPILGAPFAVMGDDRNLTLAAGDVLTWSADHFGSYFSDSTAISIRLSTVPVVDVAAPAALPLFAFGLGLIGLARRRAA